MILAAFKFLIGFAGRVNFQRQRELYEQFVQQQVFASGFGKGHDKFGWTYGPQPGTKRIAPGLRTTFAVLVVPRNTLAVELTAGGRYYKRTKSPLDTDVGDVILSPNPATEYFLSIPGKRTQEFRVDSISYTPVKKGRRVTAIIEGNYFSPQLGIMVNGVPLEPVVSISRAAGGDEEPDVKSADGVEGEYEITNSRQIVLSFRMGDNYVGTPNLTFTSPEKSTSINFFDLEHRRDDHTSLQKLSVREPMFIEDFNDKMDVELIKEVPVYYRHDLTSLDDVLRHVNARPTPLESFVAQDSTKSYILYVADPRLEKLKISYRHLTRQGYEDGSAVKDFSTPALATKVRNYRFDPSARHGEVDLTFTSSKEIASAILDDPQAAA